MSADSVGARQTLDRLLVLFEVRVAETRVVPELPILLLRARHAHTSLKRGRVLKESRKERPRTKGDAASFVLVPNTHAIDQSDSRARPHAETPTEYEQIETRTDTNKQTN